MASIDDLTPAAGTDAKDQKRIGPQETLLVGRANTVHERGEYVMGGR